MLLDWALSLVELIRVRCNLSDWSGVRWDQTITPSVGESSCSSAGKSPSEPLSTGGIITPDVPLSVDFNDRNQDT